MEGLASVTTGAGTGAVWIPQIWTLINSAWAPTLCKNGEESSPAPTLLGFLLLPDHQQSSWQGRNLRSSFLKVSGRKVSGTLIPILQLDDLSSNEVRWRSYRGHSIWKKLSQDFWWALNSLNWEVKRTFCVWAYLKRNVLLWVFQFHLFRKYVLGCYCRQCKQPMK